MPNLYPNEFNWKWKSIEYSWRSCWHASQILACIQCVGGNGDPKQISQYRFKWLQSDPLPPPHFNIAIVPERRLCPLCSVVTTLSGACLFVYLFSNMISYYWRQCTPNTRYMPCPPESSRWNTESCLYGSAVAHEETEGESLEHWDTGTITWPLHSSPCDPGPAPLLTSQHAARHWAMRCSE